MYVLEFKSLVLLWMHVLSTLIKSLPIMKNLRAQIWTLLMKTVEKYMYLLIKLTNFTTIYNMHNVIIYEELHNHINLRIYKHHLSMVLFNRGFIHINITEPPIYPLYLASEHVLQAILAYFFTRAQTYCLVHTHKKVSYHYKTHTNGTRLQYIINICIYITFA